MSSIPDTIAPPAVERPARPGSARAGLAYGLSAYIIWGFIPLYFHVVSQVPPWVVLCHRILWSALFLGMVISIRGEWRAIGEILRSRRSLLLLSAGAVLVALNWLIFIYAVASGQVLQASLGYFINPLLSIALGMSFFGERLRSWQWLAVGIAAAAVTSLTLRGGGVPWIALSLAGSFGFYGLVRKAVDIHSLHGLLVESAILLPFALLALALLPASHTSVATWGLLSLSGLVTAIPLLCFGAALRQLKLSTMGFLQYIGPTLQFLMALCLGEVLDPSKFSSFVLCWVAIGVYVADSVIHHRSQPVADEPE